MAISTPAAEPNRLAVPRVKALQYQAKDFRWNGWPSVTDRVHPSIQLTPSSSKCETERAELTPTTGVPGNSNGEIVGFKNVTHLT